ncbi:alanine:cation symporter family protein [Mammaliicoccus vitulinus]|uniref:alanine/glycine:cation symporter family protein n=1 Tax=Mammaliicoccus vitulinus TaxID=71237 RepID=UPI000E6A872F|nr:alanine/glycine:cation symporter family protein [Mammaliicoccus vitulinus]MEB7656681.1 alanine:cation symporter family protein [Mammaliicoccus vitulinus]RIN15745.1 alanine:cation symporter family protein [Mammaliicoccus vitulinus]RIN24345.1 alanine:cation symporter family protein [Mammaliicoccus vitulinus]WQK86830.1 alanine/glycine:cation symporter family protein [Mammaliicoccus vitulinus]
MKNFDSYIPSWFHDFVQWGNDLIWTQNLIFLLLLAGVFFTISSKVVQLRWLPEMFRVIFEKAETLEDGRKGISSFQAFAISAASRVGTGNIAGVATAIVLGGPGAVFWMWVIAFIGAASAFFEATLAQVYKVKDKEGGFRGGPAYYIERGLGQKWLGVVFAILITVTFAFVFNTVQSNTIAASLNEQYEFSNVITGIILAIITALVIFGGVRSIATVSSFIVPIMAIGYIILVGYILLMNVDQIWPMIQNIVKSAFGLHPAFGGAMGFAIMQGIKRGLFSNEAGMGSAANAAATAAVSHPVKQGLIQSLGVFFDTMIICSATAIMLLLYTDLQFGADAEQGVAVTQQALTTHVGEFGGIFLTVAVFMFAFSSIIGNYYYGQSNIEYLTKNKIVMFIFRILVIGMVFVGSVVQVQTVWDTADLFMGLMAIINIVALFGLATVVFEVTKDYRAQRKRKLNPVFKIENLSANFSNIEAWGDNPYKKETKEVEKTKQYQSSENDTKYEEPKKDTFENNNDESDHKDQ